MSTSTRVIYSLVMLLTVGTSFWILRRNQKQLPLSESERASLGLAAFIGTMIGAKIPFIWEQGWEGIATGNIWFTDGKTILGGIFGGYLTIECVKSWLGIRVSTGDSFAIPVAVAVCMGRIGCFLGGCCFGTVTELPWGVHFPLSGDSISVRRHPTQLYEVLFHSLAVVVLIAAARFGWLKGNQLKAYLLSYLSYRFITEWIRPEAKLFLGWTSYQWACIGLSIALIWLWRPSASTPLEGVESHR